MYVVLLPSSFISLYCVLSRLFFLLDVILSDALIIYAIVLMKCFAVHLSLSSLYSSDLPNQKTDGGQATDMTCDQRAAQFQIQSTANCSSLRVATDMLQWRYGCCGTGRSACAPDFVDYSAAVCKDKSSCTLCFCRCPSVHKVSCSLSLSISLSLSLSSRIPCLALGSYITLFS